MTDLRLLLRLLRRSPLSTLLVIATLAVGVGATTASFTYVASFFWDYVVPDPERVVWVRYLTPATGATPQPMSYLDFQDFRREGSDVGEVGAWWIWGQGVRLDDGATAWVWGHAVSDGYLEMLRANPAVGRLLSAEDHRPGASRAVVLGYRLWRRHFDLDPVAVGQSLSIGGQRYSIVGVAAESFLGTGIPADLYTPLQYTRDGAPEWDSTVRDGKEFWPARCGRSRG